MTAASIAAALRLRRVGASWRGPCPVHGGTSFALAERNGKPVWTCWSGCDREAILAALRSMGVWPQADWTPKQRSDFARDQRHHAAQLLRAARWKRGAVMTLERLKARASAEWDLYALADVSPELLRIESASDHALVDLWRRHRQEDRELAVLYERIGRTDLEICAALAALVVRVIGQSQGVRYAA